MIDDRTVIDVRTAAEYADGHVEGAINIDVEADDFEQRIVPLDHAAPVHGAMPLRAPQRDGGGDHGQGRVHRHRRRRRVRPARGRGRSAE